MPAEVEIPNVARLTQWRPGDALQLQKVLNAPGVMPEGASPLTVEDCVERVKEYANGWERDGVGRWAVRSADDRELYGYMGLKPATYIGRPDDFEVGVRLSPAAQRLRLASQILPHCHERAFEEVGIDRILGFCAPGLYGWESTGASRVPSMLRLYHSRGRIEVEGEELELFELTKDRYLDHLAGRPVEPSILPTPPGGEMGRSAGAEL